MMVLCLRNLSLLCVIALLTDVVLRYLLIENNNNSVFNEDSIMLQKQKQNQQNDRIENLNPCSSVGLFIDRHQLHKRKLLPKPKISIIYTTKRPGGYDILLNSLSQQILDDIDYPISEIFEIICIDELSPYRARIIYEVGNELNLPIVAVVPSKPKSSNYKNKKFNLFNAINTGILLARGEYIAFVSDFVWLPSNFLTHILHFYSNKIYSKSLLGFPQMVFFHKNFILIFLF
eukprot:c20624_g1_i1.p1 GENE.c20624_g1_i1~~c20624_g1_i1.p1  ORF type:complete len:232 (+),score=49.30 c20624_g1_i1:42-737(+)